MKKIDTIIVGGGISGLGCARTLSAANKDFIMITEDIGGRILMSKDGKVPYGAYFFGPDYKHVSKYLKKARKIDIFKIRFHKGKLSYFTKSSIRYPIQLIKIVRALRKFKKRYGLFKNKCEDISQKEAIKSDDYLYKLYNQTAREYVIEIGVKDIVDLYLGEINYGLLFAKIEDISAFEFLRWMQYLIMPTYEFEFQKDKIIKGFENKIFFNSVKSIKKARKKYIVKTKKEDFEAEHLVMATPIWVTKRLIGLNKKIKRPARAYMWHLKGSVKSNLSEEDFYFFPEGYKIIDIARQADGSYLFYSRNPKPKLKKYFKNYQIIFKKYWNPAFHIKGHELLACRQGKNLYVIGDHNVCGMEDSYITGIYAAKQIIKKNNYPM